MILFMANLRGYLSSRHMCIRMFSYLIGKSNKFVVKLKYATICSIRRRPYFFNFSDRFICERLGATCQSTDLYNSRTWRFQMPTSWKRLILDVWCIEQYNVYVYLYIVNCDEPASSGLALL